MAGNEIEDSNVTYRVVANHEEQYSIWPGIREIPPGWRAVGKTGTKSECLAYIEEVWIDMRPLSLRRKMENPPKDTGSTEAPLPAIEPRDDLVTYLSHGDHPVTATASSTDQLLDRIECGYVSIKFTDTRGGTELMIKLDRENLGRDNGRIHLAGNLTLNYRRVRLTAEIALDTLTGFGRLQSLPELP